MDLGEDGVADTLCNMLTLSESNYGVNNKNEYARFGNIEPIKLIDLCNKVKVLFNIDGVKVVGDLNKIITKIF